MLTMTGEQDKVGQDCIFMSGKEVSHVIYLLADYEIARILCSDFFQPVRYPLYLEALWIFIQIAESGGIQTDPKPNKN